MSSKTNKRHIYSKPRFLDFKSQQKLSQEAIFNLAGFISVLIELDNQEKQQAKPYK